MTMTMRSRLVVVGTFLCMTALTIPPCIDAAHSRRRPTAVRTVPEPRYDRSITTFSPDGRLQQVEYGLEASRRGDPVVAMATNNIVCIAVPSSDKVHRIDDHILMVTAGLVGDGNMLASVLRSQCQRFRSIMGEAPTIQEAARIAAESQHLLTRTPGRRPLGCTAILAGVDNDGTSTVRLFQTDAGGIMEERVYCAAGKGQDKVMAALEKLSDAIQSSLEGNDAMDPVTVIPAEVAKVAMEALEGKEDDTRHVDIWILQGNKHRKGGIHIKCIQKVEQKDLTLLKEHLLKSMAGETDAE